MAMKSRTTPRRIPKQDRSRATVDAILQATTYILVKDGPAGLTTNRVAERAGVNIASLYQFFPNKDALVVELERRHVERTRAAMNEVLRRHRCDDFEATVRTLVEAYVAAHMVEPALHRVFSEEMPRIYGRRSSAASDKCIDEAAALFASTKLTLPNLPLAGWMVATICHAVVHQGLIERRDDVRSGELIDELVLLLDRYLRRDEGRERGTRRSG